jgi:DNA repair exonuclease SbcCD ATPase subunit
MILLNLAIDDSEKFELLETYRNDLESFEKEYELIKASGLDVIEIENKILDITDIIDEKNNIIEKNLKSKAEIEAKLNDLEKESEDIIKALSIKDSMNELRDKYNSYKERISEIEKIKIQKQECLDKIHDNKKELTIVSEFLDKLIAKSNQLSFNKETYVQLVNEHEALKLLFEDAEVIKEALNSSKGIPLIFLQVYLKNCPIMMNNLLNTIYNGELQIDGFLINENEFRIPFTKSGIKVPDIVMASQGESSFISIVLSLSLIIQSMTKYDIICLDELDGPLDTKNREEFIKVLYSFIEQVNTDQVFIISHNNMFDNEPIDLILTGDMDVDNYKFANVVFRP